jgi:hypothetical protein
MKKFTCILVLALMGCGGEDSPPDYIKIAGGGLTFNYRYAQATMVIVGKQVQPLPEGGQVEALFDMPGQSARERISHPVIKGKLLYKLESSALKGIRKGLPLKVTLRVLTSDGQEIDREDTQFTSDVDQDTLPSKPLVDPAKPNYVPQSVRP